jgi:very-short-patch-repair endonuclease
MRNAPTCSEAALWQHLRGGALGAAFRRQVPIGRFIADFACLSARLVIEVDGGYHVERSAADARRDAYLARLGFCVLRIPANLVTGDVSAALALVRGALAERLGR